MATDVTWQESTDSGSVTTESLLGVTSDGASMWVAVGDNGTILTSSDGVSWSHATDSGSVTTEGLREVHFADSTFVAVGNNGTILTSSDGDTWTEPADSGSVTTNNLLGVIHDGVGVWVAAGSSGTIISSPDGTNWTAESSGTTNNFYGVGFGDGLFVAAGANSDIKTSTDGSTWSDESTGSTEWYVGGAAFGGGAYLAIGNNGYMTRSTTGSNFSEVNTGVGDRLTHGWYDDRDNFMVVGNNGTIISSTDEGQSWATESTPTSDHLRCVHYGDPGDVQPLWVAVGPNGVLLYGEYPADPIDRVGGMLRFRGGTLAASGGTVPDKSLGDQWGQYTWGVETWGTATDAPDPIHADAVVGRLSLRGTVLDLLNPEALPLSDDAVEYVHLNTGVNLALDDDGVEYAYLNTGVALVLDDDGAEYVHLNTTVNAEAVVGRIRLSGGTDEVLLVGYTVGSAVVNATAQAGDDALVTWDETPTGTRLDFEVFRRSPSTGARFDPVADAIATETTLLDFETGDTSRWDTANVLSAVTDRVHAGTYAGYSQSGSTPGTALAETVPDGLAGGKQISKFEFWWQETSSGSHGAGIRLVNSNGDFELGLATNNPQWYVDDANGLTEVKGNDDNYDRWVRFTVTIDWSAGTFDYDFEDPTAGTTRSGTGRPLKQGVDVETIMLENHDQQAWRTSGNAVEMWWDDILVEYPGPGARIAQGIDALEYLDAGLDAGDYDWQVFARVERD